MGYRTRTKLWIVLLAAVALLVAACSSDDDATTMATATVPSPTLPARGSLIVYEAIGAAGPNAPDIYTIDPATGETRQLTRDGSSRHPAWSPDHTQIVFASDAGEADAQEDLYIMRADGTGVRRLTTTPSISEWHPRISPDGTRVAYMSAANDSAFVRVMNIDGTGDAALSDEFSLLRSGVWSTDGKEIFFSGLPKDGTQFDIFSIDVETRQLRLRIAAPESEACPHVSPDGRTLTYGNVFEEPDGTKNIDIFAHDLADDDTSGAGDARLTDDPTVDDYGDPDAAGTSYVFVTRRDGNPELYIMSSDGSNERRLTTTANLDEDNPDW